MENIRELILKTPPPLDWCGKKHPIETIGNYYFGIGDGFRFDKDKIEQSDELFLWKMHALISDYWLNFYKEQYNKTQNMIHHMNNMIDVKSDDVGKSLLQVYEQYYNWR